MIDVTYKIFVEETKTHFTFTNFFSKILPLYEKMWKKCGTTRQATDDNITLRMRFACLIKKSLHTQNMLIVIVSPLLQWLCDRTLVLRYMYIVFNLTESIPFCDIISIYIFRHKQH